jgi:hypothetical protein
MRGQHTQHAFVLKTIQTLDTERIRAHFLSYPGCWNHLRKCPLRLLSLLRFNIKSLSLRVKDRSTYSINYMNKSVESVENFNRLNTHPTDFH